MDVVRDRQGAKPCHVEAREDRMQLSLCKIARGRVCDDVINILHAISMESRCEEPHQARHCQRTDAAGQYQRDSAREVGWLEGGGTRPLLFEDLREPSNRDLHVVRTGLHNLHLRLAPLERAAVPTFLGRGAPTLLQCK